MPARSTADESEAFEKLRTFIIDQMRMSHIYQPVMLMELLRKGGSASVEDTASAISGHDPSQIEYYAQVTILDVATTEREPAIQPDGMLDDRGWKAMAHVG